MQIVSAIHGEGDGLLLTSLQPWSFFSFYFGFCQNWHACYLHCVVDSAISQMCNWSSAYLNDVKFSVLAGYYGPDLSRWHSSFWFLYCALLLPRCASCQHTCMFHISPLWKFVRFSNGAEKGYCKQAKLVICASNR